MEERGGGGEGVGGEGGWFEAAAMERGGTRKIVQNRVESSFRAPFFDTTHFSGAFSFSARFSRRVASRPFVGFFFLPPVFRYPPTRPDGNDARAFQFGRATRTHPR